MPGRHCFRVGAILERSFAAPLATQRAKNRASAIRAAALVRMKNSAQENSLFASMKTTAWSTVKERAKQVEHAKDGAVNVNRRSKPKGKYY